jgi:putative component of toxin-antitoxin plasmid stabilization module
MRATPLTPEQCALLQKTQQYYIDAINDYAAWRVRERDKRTKTQLQKRLDEVEKQLGAAVSPEQP